MHQIIFFNIINFGLGVFVFTIYVSLYLINRVHILKYLLKIQFMIILFIVNNILWQYLQINLHNVDIFIATLPYSITFILTAVFSYYFIIFIHSILKITLNPWIKKSIVAVFLLLITIYMVIYSFLFFTHPDKIMNFVSNRAQHVVDFIIVFTSCYLVFLIVANYRIIENFIIKKVLYYLIYFIIAFILIKTINYNISQKNYILFISTDYQTCHFIWNIMCLGIFFKYVKNYMSFKSLEQKDGAFINSFSTAARDFAGTIGKYEKSEIPDDYGRKIFSALENHMIADRPYLDPELSLQKLADKLDVTRHHLSQVINRYAKKRFSDYVNRFRIERVINTINDPLEKNKKIIEIAFESGFNSKSTFNNAFKKVTGMNTVDYKASRRF